MNDLLINSTQSTQTNKARLEQLQMRDELLDKIFEDGKHRLSEVTEDSKKYTDILENLALQVSSPPPFPSKLSSLHSKLFEIKKTRETGFVMVFISDLVMGTFSSSSFLLFLFGNRPCFR